MPSAENLYFLTKKCPIRDRIFLEDFFIKNNIDTGSDFELFCFGDFDFLRFWSKGWRVNKSCLMWKISKNMPK